MNGEHSLKAIEQFEKQYDYDCAYMREMLAQSPEGYRTFENFLPMGNHKNATPTDVFYVAKLASMKTEDCGACTQLNIQMAIEAGVAKDVLKSVMANGDGLSEDLKDIYDFAIAVSTNSDMPTELYDRIESQYSREILIELALAMAATKVFPTIKRTLGYAKSCSLMKFEF